MLKSILRLLLPIIVFQIFMITLSAESTFEDIMKSVEEIDLISIEHIDIPDTLNIGVNAYVKLKQIIQQLDFNNSTFSNWDYKIQLMFGIFFIAFIIFFIIAYRNTTKQLYLKKNRSSENEKLNKLIEDRTKKLTVINRDLKYELEQLKKSSAYLKDLKNAIEKMKLGLMMTDLDGKITYTNQANANIHGYTPMELIGKDVSKLTINYIRNKFTWKNKSEWMGRPIRSSDKRKDGSSFIVELSADMIYDDFGNPAAIIIICEDLTEKENSRKGFINSEENYKRLFENIQDIYFEVDIDGKIKEISPSIKEISNLTRDELIGKPMVDLYYKKEQRDNFLKVLKKNEQVIDFDIVIKGKEDVPVSCSLTAKLMLDKNGLPSEIIGSLRNISERKKVEEQRNLTLEELTLTNKELRNFTYITSHDLKSPLEAINTIANWVSKEYEDKFDEDGKQQMKHLIDKTERMHQLIEGLFLYSNLTENEQLNNVNVTELLTNLIQSMSLPLKISITFSDKLPNVIYNKTRLNQMFSNLIENSIKFSNKPLTKIVIDCQEDEKEWTFSIRDNGPGIDEKYFENIFQIFQTLNNRDETETAGVGLAIVKKIVEMNNGKIWVESKLNSGCKFFFTIPRKRGKQVTVKNN